MLWNLAHSPRLGDCPQWNLPSVNQTEFWLSVSLFLLVWSFTRQLCLFHFPSLLCDSSPCNNHWSCHSPLTCRLSDLLFYCDCSTLLFLYLVFPSWLSLTHFKPSSSVLVLLLNSHCHSLSLRAQWKSVSLLPHSALLKAPSTSMNWCQSKMCKRNGTRRWKRPKRNHGIIQLSTVSEKNESLSSHFSFDLCFFLSHLVLNPSMLEEASRRFYTMLESQQLAITEFANRPNSSQTAEQEKRQSNRTTKTRMNRNNNAMTKRIQRRQAPNKIQKTIKRNSQNSTTDLQ